MIRTRGRAYSLSNLGAAILCASPTWRAAVEIAAELGAGDNEIRPAVATLKRRGWVDTRIDQVRQEVEGEDYSIGRRRLMVRRTAAGAVAADLYERTTP
jgi:hypothetical protein